MMKWYENMHTALHDQKRLWALHHECVSGVVAHSCWHSQRGVFDLKTNSLREKLGGTERASGFNSICFLYQEALSKEAPTPRRRLKQPWEHSKSSPSSPRSANIHQGSKDDNNQSDFGLPRCKEALMPRKMTEVVTETLKIKPKHPNIHQMTIIEVTSGQR